MHSVGHKLKDAGASIRVLAHHTFTLQDYDISDFFELSAKQWKTKWRFKTLRELRHMRRKLRERKRCLYELDSKDPANIDCEQLTADSVNQVPIGTGCGVLNGSEEELEMMVDHDYNPYPLDDSYQFYSITPDELRLIHDPDYKEWSDILDQVADAEATMDLGG